MEMYSQFRIFATALIKEYILKSFAMDNERLKNSRFFGKDYFLEWLERMRSILYNETTSLTEVATP